MRFIQEWGGTIKHGKLVAFQKWLQANEQQLAKVHPTGSVYLGTFAAIFSTEKHAGAVRTFVELDSYGAMDTAAAAAKDQSSEYGRLIAELTDFLDTANDADWSTGLYKAMVDATVWDNA